MRIYISCPVVIDEDDLQEIVDALEELYPEVGFYYWGRDEHYQETLVTSADAVAFILPRQTWSMKFSDIPSGVRKEMNLASTVGKKRLLVYTSNNGGTQLYDLTSVEGTTSGVQGSVNKVREWIKNYKVSNYTSKQPVNKPSPDDDDIWDGKISPYSRDPRLLFFYK